MPRVINIWHIFIGCRELFQGAAYDILMLSDICRV